MKRAVIQWPRLGPYHIARLRATQTLLSREGIELIALETASTDSVYAWREENREESFERVQVFPGRTFESIAPAEMHAGVTQALNRIAPDAVAIHTYSFPDSRACVNWCRENRKGAVVMTDSKADDAPRSAPREWIKGSLLSAYDAAVTAGSSSRDYLMSLGVGEAGIQLGYDVVDNAYFSGRAAVASRPADTGSTPYFLASNRFIARKNLDVLLAAFARYRTQAELESRTPWNLVMLGDGAQRAQLEALAGSGVFFPGFRQIDELPAYYAHAGAFVHTALVDQWALVINEAMASGLPIIASTGAGATRDLVRDGRNGFSFSPTDGEALTDRMTEMATADVVAMGQESLKIISEWGPDLFASSMLKALRYAAAAGDRPFPIAQRALLTTMRLATRSTTSFHTIES
ncbi:MAG: 1,2-diacylglycerol 3-alpha-glucosyltransferase [Rhodothermales bacterium]|jgi:1,2-diacylglycerol 3-alpha-glucosyltransferase